MFWKPIARWRPSRVIRTRLGSAWFTLSTGKGGGIIAVGAMIDSGCLSLTAGGMGSLDICNEGSMGVLSFAVVSCVVMGVNSG